MVRPIHLFSCVFFAVSGLASAQSAEQLEFFEKKVRPVIVKSCQGCHNAKLKTAGLDLSTAQGFVTGGASGPVIDKQHLENSRMVKVLSYEETMKMPPTGKLQPAELADINTWVKMGAPWPGASEVAAAPAAKMETRKHGRPITDEERKFWAFQQVRKPVPPTVKDTSWVHNDIDRFVLARLEQKELKPAPAADKLTLLRRVTFDLTGLPPTEKEINEFLADNSKEAFAKVVDRLLASPRYGERWGRHWLDVARYADSTGNDEDHRYPYAYRYRDYVIQAFNADLPYNQFVKEQIAGDLMPGTDPGGINKRGIVATGFLALGAKAIAQQDKQKMLYDVYDEQLDTVSKAMLGITLSCARCHDHKFDPFLQTDYYSIVNFFANTKSFQEVGEHVSKLLYVPLEPKKVSATYKAWQDSVNNKKMQREDLVEGEKERYSLSLAPRLADYMLAARTVSSGGLKVDDTAREKNLQPEVLAKWTKYLAQDWRKKPHLEEWQKAAPEKLTEIAEAYQKREQAQLQRWNEKIAKWREGARKALKEMNMPPAPRPQFKAEEDGFFFDVFIEKNGPFGIGKSDEERIFSAETKQAIARLKAEEELLKKNAPPEPEMACGVVDGVAPVKQTVLIRGDYNSKGQETPKAFPAVLRQGDEPTPAEQGSGRMALAEWLSSARNPLTARVMVNRIWQRHFADGIVRTTDNFGRMGERPTNPELLDYLAAEFVENGWSVKTMHRMILLSSVYQMSSEITPDAFQKDPENRLLSRFQRRRLDVEEIRDGLLAIDGSLDLAMGGTMQKGFGTDSENSQDRISINPDKQTRRTVYLPLRRANLPTLLNLFDFGDATTPLGKRVSTNVAPQALFMMNSEFLTERSGRLAAEISALDPQKRVEAAYIRILNRKPAAGEVDAGLTYVARFKENFNNENEAWQSMCRVLMASNEFIYVD